MKLSDITRLAKKPESSTLEFKRSTAELDRAVETLVAFLNAKGGTVLIGVRGDGTIDGIEVSDKTRQQVATAVRQIEPAADVAIEYVESAPKRTVITFTCEPGSHGPYTLDGRAYVRVDNTTRRMKPEEYEERVLHRRHATDRWETAVARGYAVKDLDAAEIVQAYDDAVRVGRLNPTASRRARDIAERLRLVTREGVILHGAVAVFGKRIGPEFPQCSYRLARFKGRDKTEFIDQKQEFANAFQVLREAEAFIRRNTKLAGRILPDRMEREDTPEYPIEAVREALVNAICHRDYTIPGGAVSVAIFDDRLEVINTGKLAAGVHIEDLKRDHESLPRNPNLAEVFYRRGMIEKWGRGTQKIVEICKTAGSPEPEFEERAGAVAVRFFARLAHVNQLPPVPGLAQRQQTILDLLRESDSVSPAQLLAALRPAVTDRTLRADLDRLVALGLVQRTGKARATRYRLVIKGGGRS